MNRACWLLLPLYSITLISLGPQPVTLQSYNCTIAGRFSYYDSTCRAYYLCVLYQGVFIKSNYTCPSTMIFDGSTQTCSATAVCSANICDQFANNAILNQKIPDPNNPTCTTYIQCLGSGADRYPVTMSCAPGLYFNQNLFPIADCSTLGDCT